MPNKSHADGSGARAENEAEPIAKSQRLEPDQVRSAEVTPLSVELRARVRHRIW
jgi:hypothetical protein